MSIFSKVMEKVFNIQLIKYLEQFNIINDRQFGFRSRRSTGDLLSYVSQIWSNTIEKHGASRAVALDISKAFDQVWHEGLLNKLPAYGLSTKLCVWIANVLSERCIHVVVEHITSSTCPVNAGVPQGSVLSPTLFLLHINDLLAITQNPVYSFADDSTLISSFSSARPLSVQDSNRRRNAQIESINNDLEIIAKWGLRNMVEFNATKTQYTTFSLKTSCPETNITMSGADIASTDFSSVLGVTVSGEVSYANHVKSIAKKAAQKLGFLFRARKYFSAEQLLTLYKAQIRPQMEYCSHVWSSAPKYCLRLLDSFQRRASKLINKSQTICIPSNIEEGLVT